MFDVMTVPMLEVVWDSLMWWMHDSLDGTVKVDGRMGWTAMEVQWKAWCGVMVVGL